MEFATLKYERDGRIARITLNRPDRPNAIDERMPREIRAAAEEASKRPASAVLSGMACRWQDGFHHSDWWKPDWEHRHTGRTAA